MKATEKKDYFSVKYLFAGEERRIMPSLNAFDCSNTVELTDINRILELYNIQQFFNNDEFASVNCLDKNIIDTYNKLAEAIDNVIKEFFLNLTEESLVLVYESCDVFFRDDFWYLFFKYQVYSKISKERFAEIITDMHVSPGKLLENKQFVKMFDSQITQLLKQPDYGAEFLVRCYMGKEVNHGKIHFPKELTKEDKYNTVKEYINTEQVSAKVLDLIINGRSRCNKEFDVDYRLKFLAKERYAQYWRDNASRALKFNTVINVSFSPNNPFSDVQISDEGIKARYNSRWIEENKDYQTLMNNFIFMFGFTDGYSRCSLTAARLKQGDIEKVFATSGNGIYPRGRNFEIWNSLANEVLLRYETILSEFDISIEEIITWFFESYLPSEFNATGFSCNLPSHTESILSRYERVASAMDGITKQFKLYCEDREINHGLYEMMSGSIRYKEIPSLISNKYAYANSDEILREMKDVFSEHNTLHFTERTKTKYNTFFDLIINEPLSYDEIMSYNKAEVDWLIERGTISLTNNTIKPNDERLWILQELYDNGVICLQYKNSMLLKELITKGEIKVESSLLSKPEWEYFDYILNKSEFTNGLDLRNKYIHNTISNDEKIHQRDYIILLKMFIILIIKINEEFCLNETLCKHNKNFYSNN